MDARNLYTLGNIYLAQDLQEKAISCHEQALITRSQIFKEAHPYKACSNYKLGTLSEGKDWNKAVYVEISTPQGMFSPPNEITDSFTGSPSRCMKISVS